MSTPVLEKTATLAPPSELPNPPVPVRPVGEQGPQYSDTETYSKQILGKSAFELYKLHVVGTKGNPAKPWHVAPEQSPFIIDDDAEKMIVGVYIEFDRSPLTKLLLCLGTKIVANFHFEGFGGLAAEKDLKVEITSKEGQFRYWIGDVLTPADLGLNSGYYQVASTVQIGPVTEKCGQYVFGYGYIGEIRVQIAQQPNTLP